jgi:hypothetical protein
MERRTLNKNVKEARIGDVYQKRGGSTMQQVESLKCTRHGKL